MLKYLINPRKGVYRDFGPTLPFACECCKAYDFGHFVRVHYCFSLFSVPLIPHQIRYYVICKNCGTGPEYAGQRLEKLREVNYYARKYFSLRMGRSAFEQAIREVDLGTIDYFLPRVTLFPQKVKVSFLN